MSGFAGGGGGTGPQGPAGPAGPTGPTGPTGGAGSFAHGAVYSTSTATVAAGGGNVTFNITSGSSSAITQSAAGFTIVNTGIYEYRFQVRGTPEILTPPNPLIFGLSVNGTLQQPQALYASDTQTSSLSATGTEAVTGFGLISLTSGQTVALTNDTNSGSDTVTLTSAPLGGPAAVNAALMLTQIA